MGVCFPLGGDARTHIHRLTLSQNEISSVVRVRYFEKLLQKVKPCTGKKFKII